MNQQKRNRFLLAVAITITVAISIFIVMSIIEKQQNSNELTLLRIQEVKLSIQPLELQLNDVECGNL